MNIRLATLDDELAMVDLHERAIRQSALSHYSEMQVDVWATRVSLDMHRAAILAQSVWVAEMDGVVGGFVSLSREKSLLNMLYVDPDFGRRGIGSDLTSRALAEARASGLSELLVSASHLSRPVFERAGFEVVERRIKVLDGVEFESFFMRIELDTGGRS